MEASVTELANRMKIMEDNQNQMFLLFNGFFILIMQCGFAFLEAGSVRSKNTVNILMKNLLDLSIGAAAFWSFGFAFAYGKPGNGFIGHNHFFASNVEIRIINSNDTYGTHIRSTPENFHAIWFFQYVFAATAATIVSGAMAERTEFYAYITYSFILSAFIYPVIAHWVWSKDGWLNSGLECGLKIQDFAGGTTVHVCGGVAALVGCKILGPRVGRFSNSGTPKMISGHSITHMSLGAFLLMLGFLSFNGGSVQRITGPGDATEVALAVMNTVIGGASGSLTAVLSERCHLMRNNASPTWSLPVAINGALIGMLSQCCGCNDTQPWAAMIIGITSGFALGFAARLVVKLKIDDPVDAVAVHLCGGTISTVLTPFFVIRGQLDEHGDPVGGIIYGGHKMAWFGLLWNILGWLVIVLWTGTLCLLLFGTLMKFGLLRIDKNVELIGIDIHEHGGITYPEITLKEDKLALEFSEQMCAESKVSVISVSNNVLEPPPSIEAWVTESRPSERELSAQT